MTILVRRIAITVSLNEFETFIAEKIPEGDPVVKSLVYDANRAFKSATVTFKGSTKAQCKATIERLKNSDDNILRDDTGTISTLDFDEDFLGITELANWCAEDEKPYFEYVLAKSRGCLCLKLSSVYFVHGLGGHAYNSFRHKAKSHRKSNMWARDTLPHSLDRPGKRGRYLTFGYPAPLVDSEDISQSVEATAETLLQKIISDRGKVVP